MTIIELVDIELDDIRRVIHAGTCEKQELVRAVERLARLELEIDLATPDDPA
jgi:hypothetical protein